MHIVVGAFRNPAGEFTLVNIVNLFRPRSSPRSGSRSGSASPRRCSVASSAFAVAAAVSARRAAALAARAGADLLRGRLELRRRAAGLRFPRDAGTPRAGHGAAARAGSASTSSRSASTCLSFWGLTLTYLFFQIPLMILIVTPALDGLKREWSEAAQILGATRLPVLAHGGAADPLADAARHAGAAVRQCLRGGGDRLCADRIVAQHRANPALRSDPRRRAAATHTSATRSPSA